MFFSMLIFPPLFRIRSYKIKEANPPPFTASASLFLLFSVISNLLQLWKTDRAVQEKVTSTTSLHCVNLPKHGPMLIKYRLKK